MLFLLTAIWVIMAIPLKENFDMISLALFLPNVLLSIAVLLFNLLFCVLYGCLLFIIDIILFNFLAPSYSANNTIYILQLTTVGVYITVIFSYYTRLQFERRSSNLAIQEQHETYNMATKEYSKNLLKNQKLKEEIKRMKKLSQTSALLGTSFDSSEDIISGIVKETKDILGLDKVLFSMPNSEKKHYVITEAIGYSQKHMGQPTDNIDEWLEVLKFPVLITDIDKEGRIKLKRYSNFSNASSIIASPVLLKDKVYGILRMESDETDVFSNDDLRVASYITDMASIVVENNYYYKEVEKLAITDGITGLFVHRYFNEKMDSEIERYFRHNVPFSLIMLDVDNFKILNDTYGHPFGDKVLVSIAKTIRSAIREVDFPARYGGDEFAVILPHTTMEGSKSLGERLFERICATKLNELTKSRIKHSLSISMSIGSFKKIYKDRSTFINKVDKKLYDAKSKGKNRIEILK
ncbi:MAG: sensor domain-containing diguanylate cyclase [Spirochaetes bacterium]|nr:sensor domain-containing diguanylate cyclase [Spirochaetota bacterium]